MRSVALKRRATPRPLASAAHHLRTTAVVIELPDLLDGERRIAEDGAVLGDHGHPCASRLAQSVGQRVNRRWCGPIAVRPKQLTGGERVPVQLRFDSGHEQPAQLVFEVGATGQADNEG